MTIKDWLPYLYLLRVSWISLLIVIALVAAAAFSPLSNVVGGAFDLTPPQVFWVTLAAGLCGVTIAVVSSLVLEYGPLRFASLPFQPPPTGIRRRYIWLTLACVLLTVGPVLFEINQTSSLSVLGVVIGLACVCLVLAVAYVCWRIPAGRILNPLVNLLSWSPEGYLNPTAKSLLPGHAFALAWAFVFLTFHGLIGIVSFSTGRVRYVPTLVFVLGMISVTCWFFSGLAFFFDKLRVPVLIPFFLIVGAAGLWQDSDHFFAVRDGQATPPRSAQVLNADAKTPILIVTSGGGIHAEAWTVQVLTELDKKFGNFAESVRLISGVSGGSVGAMQYVEGRYGDWWSLCTGRLSKDACLKELVHVSTESSLEYVVWGLVYPDVVRSLVPALVPRPLDRGYGLETGWTEAWQAVAIPNSSALTATMEDWTKNLERRPAVIFNSTLVETGDRIVFSSFDFEDEDNPGPLRTKLPMNFRKLYRDHKNNVPVRTAVRLSATFPYASPVARSEEDLPQRLRYHFADGGYYDNYGVLSAINFLDDASREDNLKGKHILLIEIRDSKSSTQPRAARASQGWFQQFQAPLATLLNVRDTAQRKRNDTDVALLAKSLGAIGIVLKSAVFEYPAGDAALSWHLTPNQKSQISDSWLQEFEKGEGVEQVKQVGAFLDGIQ
jgi:hypothetical protein